MANVEVENIGKSFAGRPVLSNLDLSIGDGELICLLGPSGCGKTTLLRIIAGFIAPDAGRVRVGGADVIGVDFPERGMLFDLLIEKRLRDGGVVDFAVAVAAEADEIDDYVAVEFVAVFGGDACDADDRVDIFGVDVEDRDGLTLGQVRREAGRMLVARRSGEAD